jgi:large subunit ribosomal protein L3
MKFILATKENMTQIFTDDGKAVPTTLVSAGPVVVTQLKTVESDGYDAVQIGFGQKKDKNIKKPQKHLNKLTDSDGGFRYLREFKNDNGENFEVGQKIDSSIFEEGATIRVSGISKGKGFQGVVRRHGFKGGPRTHGQKHSEREPGSIGSTGPQRVFKGTRMAGRMGTDRITVTNLKIVKIDNENNKMWISGAVPGRKGTLLEIRST